MIRPLDHWIICVRPICNWSKKNTIFLYVVFWVFVIVFKNAHRIRYPIMLNCNTETKSRSIDINIYANQNKRNDWQNHWLHLKYTLQWNRFFCPSSYTRFYQILIFWTIAMVVKSFKNKIYLCELLIYIKYSVLDVFRNNSTCCTNEEFIQRVYKGRLNEIISKKFELFVYHNQLWNCFPSYIFFKLMSQRCFVFDQLLLAFSYWRTWWRVMETFNERKCGL